METTDLKDNTKVSFGFLLKKEATDRRKSLLLSLCGILGAYIISGMLMGLIGTGGGNGETALFYFFTLLAGCVAGSLMFAEMKTKQGRIAILMLPAPVWQKFLVRWIAVVPLLLVVCIAGFYLGDIFRLITGKLADVYTSETEILSPFKYMFALEGNELPALTIGSYLFTQSLYILGSILWPKLSFIKTFGAIYAVELILTMGILGSFRLFVGHVNFDWLPDNSEWILITLTYILTALCYWLAYRRFRDSEVAYHLF